MSDEEVALFEQKTAEYVMDFNFDDVFDVTTTIKVTKQDPPFVPLVRRLNTDPGFLVIEYDQTISYRTNDPNVVSSDVLKGPWLKSSSRASYIEEYLLQENPNNFFDGVEDATVTFPNENANANQFINNDEDDEGGSGGLIGGIVGGLAGVGLLVGGLVIRKKRQARKDEFAVAMEDDIRPPSQLQLSQGDEEVSTLAEPTPRLGVMTSNESLAGYGDQSVATVDYDYSKAYGGGGDTSVSSAGGTLGENTRGGLSGAGTTETPGGTISASVANQSMFSDDASFEAHYRGQSPIIREELIDIYAPPGKLGVVIDTPDDDAPVVHAIKDSSCIADKLKVGDKLVAVDDEDVRSMTAIKVSKMISRKSANPTRKLSVIRMTVAE